MNEFLIKQGIWVNTDQDRVVLCVGRTEFPMPYAQAFKISAAVRVGCRRLMQMSGEPHHDWYERSKLDYYAKVPELSEEVRRTRTKKYDWRVDHSQVGEVLELWLDDCLLEFHFEAGLKLSEWLRDAAKRCKRWAGDSSSMKIACGILSDAEWNYKHGLNKILQ